MKAIIVGGGVAGLAAAIRLRAANYEVEIFEKNSSLGGKMSVIKEAGFTFDKGPTIVMMPHVYKEVFIAAGKDPDKYISMEELDSIYRLYFTKEEQVNISNNMADLTGYLESVSEEDAKGFYKYLADIYKRYLIAKNDFIEKSFHGPFDFYNPKTLYKAMQLKTFDDAYSSIARYVKDDKLRKMLSFQTLYIGISPYNGPSIYTIIPMIELIYGVWYMKGGMNTYAKAMEKLALELGVKIHLDQEVEEIVIENNQVKGIMVRERFIPADQVLCNADFPYAISKLVKDKKTKGKYTDKKINNMDYSCSGYLLYLGLNRKIENMELHNVIFSKDFKGNIEDIFSRKLPEDPSIYVYSPSRIDPSMAPEGQEGLYILVPVPSLKGGEELYGAEKIKEYRKLVLAKISDYFAIDDIEGSIVFEKSMNPEDFVSDYNSYYGAAFGLAPTLFQSNYFRPKIKSSCKGLFFAGSSVHPGAGVPIVLTSAKLAAEDMILEKNEEKNDDKKWI